MLGLQCWKESRCCPGRCLGKGVGQKERLGMLGFPDSAEMCETLEGAGLLALSDSGPKSLDKETLGEAYSKARKKPSKPRNPAELC